MIEASNQDRVEVWACQVLGLKSASDIPERVLRAVEEVVELAQAVDIDHEQLHRLIDYVYSRPTGLPAQEIAGSMVTIYAAAGALGIDAQTAFESEMKRIQQPEVIERVRKRQAEKRAAIK
jgi:NTP pyrophosphatase (non-canonical NTP hydrolase)